MSVGIFKVKTKLDRPFGLFFDRTIKVFLLEEGFFVFLAELTTTKRVVQGDGVFHV